MKKIGITSSTIEIDGKYYVGQDRYYFDAVERLGAKAYLLPRIFDLDKIQVLVDDLDGIIFSGGSHVNPNNYNKDNILKNYDYDNERDYFEINLAKLAKKSYLPILGICRGQQLLNVAFGGSLFQAIPTTNDKIISHLDKKNPFDLRHQIKVSNSSKLYEIFQSEIIEVNSIHSQAIDKLSDYFMVKAYSSDDIIEAIEAKDENNFIKAYQFHPEKLIDKDEKFLELIDDFIEKCTEKNKNIDKYKLVDLEGKIHENMMHYVLGQDEFNSYQDLYKNVLFVK